MGVPDIRDQVSGIKMGRVPSIKDQVSGIRMGRKPVLDA
jgi:hypothetical protein